MRLTDEQIREIAEELDCGFRCFWNRQSNELLFVPDLDKNPEMENEVYDEDFEKLDNNFFDYNEIKPMESSDTFEMMEEFTELVDNSELKNKLATALARKKPFREFKFIIDNSGIDREKWFDFKNKKLKEWVLSKVEEVEKHSEENNIR
jgi:hypothetical protein